MQGVRSTAGPRPGPSEACWSLHGIPQSQFIRAELRLFTHADSIHSSSSVTQGNFTLSARLDTGGSLCEQTSCSRGGQEASPSLSKALGVRGMFVPCQKHASPLFLGWNAHSKRQELCEGGGRTSGSTGLEQKSYPRTPAYSSALGSDVYYTWLINAWERREGGNCVSQICDVEAKRLGHGQSPDERGWGMSLGATAFLGDFGVPRMSSRSAEKSSALDT